MNRAQSRLLSHNPEHICQCAAASSGEITHHNDVVVAHASHIKRTARAFAEAVALVEVLRFLIAAIGTQDDGRVTGLACVGDGSFNQRIGDTAPPPLLVHVALGQVGTAFLDAPGAYKITGQRVGTNVCQHITDERALDLGNKKPMLLRREEGHASGKVRAASSLTAAASSGFASRT